MMRRRALMGVLVMIPCLVLNAAVVLAIRERSRAGPIVAAAPIGFHALVGDAGLATGSSTAPIRVWVFGDYECPACARFEAMAGPRLRALAAAGHVRLTYVHASIAGSADARLGAAASYCAAAQGDPWPMHALLAARSWSSAPDPATALMALAGEASLDGAALRSCLSQPRTTQLVSRDLTASQRIGIDRVPTVIVNGQRVRMRRSPGEVLDFVEERIRRRGEPSG
jgi:protein-disulfide isomerase